MKDLLFLSNGHGEDTIACRILDEVRALRPSLALDAWAMVGRGEAYAARGVPLVGAPNLLPSAGFALLNWKLFTADLRAGWVAMYWRQFRDGRRFRGRYRLMVAVGDIVPMACAALSKTPFLFVGCAKSDYYTPKYRYNALEKHILRRHCMATYPRDSLTARALAAAGVPVRDAGNPMMDGLEGSGDALGVPEGGIAVAMMPGTRHDAEVNFLDLLAAAAATARRAPEPARLRFLFPVRTAFDVVEMAGAIAADPRFAGCVAVPTGEGDGVVLRVALPGGAEAVVAKARFADTLRLSRIAVGMAGTANEQAVGMGLPLVAVPARGMQGEDFVRMKALYFGEAAVSVPREPKAVAQEILAILGDPQRAARMAAAGRERMGPPGASAAIAADVIAALDAMEMPGGAA